MVKDIGMTIRKGIVVSFLPCLVAFWGFHPYMLFHFFSMFFLLLHNLTSMGSIHIAGSTTNGSETTCKSIADGCRKTVFTVS